MWMQALQQTWTRDEVQQVMCLRLQVVQCHSRVVWTSVALSSMESEYMAASAAAQEAIWLNRVLEEMGFRSMKPIILYEDNKAAILFSDHPDDHRRSKHIDTRKYFLRDAVINGEIKLEYIKTTEQLADGITEALTPDHHLQGVRGLLTSYQMSKNA